MRTFATAEKEKKNTSPARRFASSPALVPPRAQLRSPVREILSSREPQFKLTIGAPDDVYEQEADRVADAVMRMPEPAARGSVQRVCAECAEGEPERLQRQAGNTTDGEEVEESDGLMQAKDLDFDGGPADPEVTSSIAALRGGGERLSATARDFFEPRFGRNFEAVRVHTDRRASETARAIGARAFAIGRDVVFDQGEYAPETTEGKRLLGHELTHVVQQNPGTPPSSAARHADGTVRTSAAVDSIQRAPKKKLNKAMMKFADEELWTRHPKLKRRKLTMSTADAALRKEWWRYFNFGKGALSKGNCYRYSVGDPKKSGEAHSPFPGGPDPGGHVTCAQIMGGAKKLGASDATKDKACPKGSGKIAGVIQDKSAPKWNDYHWYRLESNGLWTHKRGRNVVEHEDASGKPIKDPAVANRKYPGAKDYDKFCGYLCMPRGVDVDKP